MKAIISRFLFWVILLVVIVALGLVQVFLVRPINVKNEARAAKLKKQITDIKQFVNAPKIVNPKWFHVAEENVVAYRKERDRCLAFIEKYRHDWDKPIPGQKGLDPDVFRFDYDDAQVDFAEKYTKLIDFEPKIIKWPLLPAKASAADIAQIQRYYWVQEALLDVIIAGRAKTLLLLDLPKLPKPSGGKDPFQIAEFKVKVSMNYTDLADLINALLDSNIKFLCNISTLEVVKDDKILPVMKTGQPIQEPPVTVTITGKLTLFEKKPAKDKNKPT